ncbi:MAG: conjugative transposon protein TraM [Chitinophagaceae bacterium]
MIKQKYGESFKKKRRMLMVMPLLIFPFVTLAFWALGGGKGKAAGPQESLLRGLNLNLPDPNLKDDQFADKLSFYDKADKDSAKMSEWMRSDPYYQKPEADSSTAELEQLTRTTATKFNQKLNTSPLPGGQGNPDKQIMDKISLLQKELNKTPLPAQDSFQRSKPMQGNSELYKQVDRLQTMMQGMSEPADEDTEMKGLDGTLERILDIQHPERVKDRLKEKSLQNKTKVFAVSKENDNNHISLLDTGRKALEQNGFYGLGDSNIDTWEQSAIEAVVQQDQTLVNGAVIKLRLYDDIYISGVPIPKGTLLFGYVALNDERLTVEINSIRFNNSLYPVKLEVYDMDGLAGIYIPGAISRDVAKQSADNTLQLMELSAVDPSLKAQAAGAGLSAAKSLISKKVKLIKVMVKAGYRLLLKEKNGE